MPANHYKNLKLFYTQLNLIIQIQGGVTRVALTGMLRRRLFKKSIGRTEKIAEQCDTRMRVHTNARGM